MPEQRLRILSPFSVKNVELKNRIVMAPMGNHLQGSKGEVTDKMIHYLEERARGGTGLIITPFASVSPHTTTFGAYSDDLIPGLKRLADTVKKYGAKVLLQINHKGSVNPDDRAAVSSIPTKLFWGFPRINIYWEDILPRELTTKEIKSFIHEYVSAAARAKKAGYDGVEFHGGYAYLVGEFYSPHLNKRNDEYGGSFENRMRFLDEVIIGIRNELGEEFPIGFKLNVHEHVQGGIDTPEGLKIAKHLEKMGIAYIHVVGSFPYEEICEYSGLPTMYADYYGLIELAGSVKREVNVPVIATGGVVLPEHAEQVIRDGKGDLVAIGRGLIADPEWVLKVEQKKKVRSCIKCNRCHIREVLDVDEVRCTVNPEAGREYLTPIKKALVTRKICIIGGGPAGMEAALIASRRGHNVRLFEKKGKLGGKLALASLLPFKKTIKDYIENFSEEILNNEEIEVELNHKVLPAEIEKIESDVIICAVGAKPIIPSLPGIMDEGVVNAIDLLGKIKNDPNLEGLDNFLILGAGLVGCEIAWFLGSIGKEIALFDLLEYDDILMDEHPLNRAFIFKQIRELGIPFLCNRRLGSIEKGKAVFFTETGREEIYNFNFFVLATGYSDNTEFCNLIQNKASGKEFHSIGDCRESLGCYDAIHEAFKIACEL